MLMREFPLDRAFTFFEPGPVLLVVTSIHGKHNIMTASCTASLGFTPIIGVALGPWNHSYRPAVERRAYIQQHAPAVPVHGHHHYAPVVPEISVRPYYRPRRVYVDSYYVPAVRVVTPRVVVRVPF